MSIKRMKGFIDPITLGFVVAIVGTTTVMSVEKPSEKSVEAAQLDTVVADQTQWVAQTAE